MSSNNSNTDSIAAHRREYGSLSIDEKNIPATPMPFFKAWLSDAIASETTDPTAMVVSTTDENGYPDSRILLLKDVSEDSFCFFTNYQSTKADQMKHCDHVAINFYWPVLARQVRIHGIVSKASPQCSDDYFSSRPENSQIAASISPQSQVIDSMEGLLKRFEAKASTQEAIKRPDEWGGYVVKPHQFEFWQGRDNRLHDRIQYTLENGSWSRVRLAP